MNIKITLLSIEIKAEPKKRGNTMKLNWEVIVTEVGGNRTDVIPCKNKREALKVEKECKENPKYEMVYVQANNGTEIVDEW